MRFYCIFLLLCVGIYDVSDARKRHHKKTATTSIENHLGDSDENLRPIVGILSIEPSAGILKTYKFCHSYIAASYVKFVEMAGARAVPIFIDRPAGYYEKIFNGINGLLIPGGGIELYNLNASGYAQAGQTLFNMAVTANENGDYFPIFGICLGSELLSILLDAKNTYRLTACSCSDVALPLNLTKGYERSRLFLNLPSDVYGSLTTLPVTANFHKKCLTPESVLKTPLNSSIHILSTNEDVNNLTFVSTYEAIKYPFYGLQWHPEKNPYEWTLLEKSLPHTAEAVRVSQHMANFFISEVRKNKHHFESVKEEEEALIYNQRPFPTFNVNTTFSLLYVFRNSTK